MKRGDVILGVETERGQKVRETETREKTEQTEKGNSSLHVNNSPHFLVN